MIDYLAFDVVTIQYWKFERTIYVGLFGTTLSVDVDTDEIPFWDVLIKTFLSRVRPCRNRSELFDIFSAARKNDGSHTIRFFGGVRLAVNGLDSKQTQRRDEHCSFSVFSGEKIQHRLKCLQLFIYLRR